MKRNNKHENVSVEGMHLGLGMPRMAGPLNGYMVGLQNVPRVFINGSSLKL